MVSPEQADKASDSLLEPSKKELAKRQAKLAARKAALVSQRMSPLFPAAVGAAVALLAQDADRFSSDMIPFLIGAIAGWVFGLVLRRGQGANPAQA
ncbi:MAG: hypothetical protein QNJ19_14005 [Woeseiaceae bacterium]|nr:hypothetical protein [Woeseiaceae bacterium]